MLHTGIEIVLYTVDELQEKAKRKALEDMREFELSMIDVSDYVGMGDPDLDTPESMYKEDYDDILFNDERVLEDIRINEYMYFANGEQADIVQYCANHPHYPGQTHFTFNGQIYKIGG